MVLDKTSTMTPDAGSNVRVVLFRYQGHPGLEHRQMVAVVHFSSNYRLYYIGWYLFYRPTTRPRATGLLPGLVVHTSSRLHLLKGHPTSSTSPSMALAPM